MKGGGLVVLFRPAWLGVPPAAGFSPCHGGESLFFANAQRKVTKRKGFSGPGSTVQINALLLYYLLYRYHSLCVPHRFSQVYIHSFASRLFSWPAPPYENFRFEDGYY